MGGVDYGVAIGCTHTDTAEGTAVRLGSDHDAAKALIANGERIMLQKRYAGAHGCWSVIGQRKVATID